MKARSQSEHEAINRREYPGTRQLCERCGDPTERCEEDSIYTDSGEGPLCVGCYDTANNPLTHLDARPDRICERAATCDRRNSDNEPCRHGAPHALDSGCEIGCCAKAPVGAVCVVVNEGKP